MQQLVASIKLQTSGEFKNITQSTGFLIKKNGIPQFSPIMETYQRVLDSAMMDISTGTFDYNTVIKRSVKELVDSGLKTIDYASGRKN